jgi:hypothetical protein
MAWVGFKLGLGRGASNVHEDHALTTRGASAAPSSAQPRLSPPPTRSAC